MKCIVRKSSRPSTSGSFFSASYSILNHMNILICIVKFTSTKKKVTPATSVDTSYDFIYHKKMIEVEVCWKLFNICLQGKLMVRGFLNAVRTVYRLGGPLGFFKGLSARVMFQMPATAISWSTYEFFKYFLISRGKEDHHHEDKKRWVPRKSKSFNVNVLLCYCNCDQYSRSICMTFFFS